MHEMISIILDGRLHISPIGTHPQHCLDIGAGSGIWCIDFAELYPSAEVIGVDISATMPTMVPPNCKFEIDDVEDEWTYNFPFDYIHSRYMAGSIKDWPRLMNQCFE
jgi:trans-aconitate methyltransferase